MIQWMLFRFTVFSSQHLSESQKIKLINPTKKVKNNFNEIIKPIFDKTIENHKENKTLKQLRNTLLPKLMSGEIRVPLEENEEV